MNSTDYFTGEYFTVRKSLMLVAAAGLLTIPATASAQTPTCKMCHQIDKDGVGPAWRLVVKAYGTEKRLEMTFKGGFKVEDRVVAHYYPKWKSHAHLMTGQYEQHIKKGGREAAAAHYVFEVVRQGRFY